MRGLVQDIKVQDPHLMGMISVTSRFRAVARQILDDAETAIETVEGE